MGQGTIDHARIRVVLVDNHTSYRTGLRTLLELERDIVVVGEAGTGDAALAVLKELDSPPDVVVLDVDMPGMSGIQATRTLLKDWQGLPILLLTAYAHYAEAGIQAGARGYVLKEQDGDDILQAIRTLHRGGAALHPIAQVQLVDSLQGRSPRLLPRELDILTRLSHGATTAKIGAELSMSESAVSRVIASIEEKLEASSRAHAVATALRRGLIQ